ncbi:MDR family MFS transporter [Nocardia sp. NPDC059091]|uniref:MDR family MFS transporter n=1 Tax=unclassified Nocardia TaxID=2637762 RepID=UPI003687F381
MLVARIVKVRENKHLPGRDDLTTAKSAERLDPAFRRLATVLLVGVVPVTFDTTIVNVALHTISSSLHTTILATQWTLTGYVLAMAMIMPISGWAIDRFGDKRTWIFALGVFLLASILAGVAPNIGCLIAFRILQGCGGGLMLPTMQTILVRNAGGRPMGQVMALTSIVAVAGPIFGPVVGGLITNFLVWRWIFWVNIPFCVAGLVLAARVLDTSGEQKDLRRLDVKGLVLLPPALAAIIFGLSQVGVHGGFGAKSVLIPVGAGLVLLAAFVFHALKTNNAALIDLRLFRSRPFSASTSMLFLYGFVLQGTMLLLPLYYQQERGQSALAAGLLLAPQGVGSLLVRGRTGKLSDRLGARPVVLGGFVLATIGTFIYTQAGVNTNEYLLSLSLVIRGAGLGALAIPIMSSAYGGLTRTEIPHASSATRIMQQLGGSFGTAALAVILQTQLVAHHGSGSIGQQAAFQNAFWWCLAFTVLAVIPAFALPGRAHSVAAASA